MVVLKSQRKLWRPKAAAPGVRVRSAQGFTLIELLIAMGIAFTTLGGLAFGFMQAYRITDSAVLQAAAQRLAVNRLEMVRVAEWQFYGSQPTNQLTNFVGMLANVPLPATALTLDAVLSDIYTDVTMLSTNPPLARIQVRCVWASPDGFAYTNEITTVRAPD